MRTNCVFALLACLCLVSCQTDGPPATGSEASSFPELKGAYLGQPLPGADPELFAPGIVSTGLATRDVAMTPDGTELYFGVSIGARSAIMVTRQRDGVWTEPVVAPFSGRFNDLEPCIAPDGQRLFFLSSRPAPGEERQPGWTIQDIWVMDRVGDAWGEPEHLGAPVNTDAGEYFPSVTRDGTLYFTRDEEGGASAIYRARPEGDGFAIPERLGPEVNHGRNRFNAFVDPDERFLIVPSLGREDSLGGVDYYLVFRSADDRWSEPVNMGPRINQVSGREWSASLSPDGEFLFFMSSKTTQPDGPILEGLTVGEILDLAAEPGTGASAIWWVEADFIEDLRPEGF